MNMTHRPPLWLLTLLIMFPQLVETIYSPALPNIATFFQISSERAAQTLSVYFVAFAVGVALWGWLSDCIGRRWAMVAGLLCYGAGSVMAVIATDFSVLLLARMVSAIGAAAGSVVVQTMLRDSYESTTLSRIFSIMGAALAISPVFGLVSGGWLVSLYGHTGVFTALVLLAILLLMLTAALLPETRPETTRRPQLTGLVSRMVRDSTLWKNAMLVALLNTMLFSYYSLAPFLFGQLGWSSRAFGWTGSLLALASLSGSLLNRKLLTIGLSSGYLVRHACALALLSGLAAWWLQHSVWILLPVVGVVVAYGIAIPNVLSQALHHYREQAGAAGALFGLCYYLLLGMMLGLAGIVQQLGLVLAICAFIAWLCSLCRR
ncbi:multidrug effflux MFS transporter [Citrobacter sp. FDAARGOS_156]|uniref:multidrug effflux MFS transporter n=1 Tax=Citrobacter TaxID=544 RepID=UPI000E152F6D|nr:MULTISPECIES: multidrug effflux MFS transporter [Citrobacter]EIS7448946.1 multidrug effflux MFS transporter [Citrobacter youngae]MBJ8740954.1 multidrug effflux MFS transporter [Citrobacter sp. FDAARGOS_156]MBJ9158901.1 multidrug effflux MFS transporter [Citrobacter sp. FDAARGOS_156]MBJ9201925.1 multidrug effflux MFS transporter [Citrobacter sp. FDAARGOS_156]SUY00781.1 inner membrane transport protein YdhC [Citrobacter youngae]